MSSPALAYLALSFAIACELMGTTFLQMSEQFTKILPTVALLLFYSGSFYFLSQALRTIPLGVAYAIWSGVGVGLTVVIGAVVFRQALDLPALIGIAMIVGGVVVMQTLSTMSVHRP